MKSPDQSNSVCKRPPSNFPSIATSNRSSQVTRSLGEEPVSFERDTCLTTGASVGVFPELESLSRTRRVCCGLPPRRYSPPELGSNRTSIHSVFSAWESSRTRTVTEASDSPAGKWKKPVRDSEFHCLGLIRMSISSTSPLPKLASKDAWRASSFEPDRRARSFPF